MNTYTIPCVYVNKMRYTLLFIIYVTKIIALFNKIPFCMTKIKLS